MSRSQRPVRFGSIVRLTAVLAAASLVLTGCFGIGSSNQPRLSNTGEVTVNALYVAGDSGGHSPQRISVQPDPDGQLTIDISEDEVTGFGDMTRAASWNAVIVSTLLTGAPMTNRYRFEFSGRIDGPSAGGITTVGVLSILLGDELDPGVTMTGTINPTGTIGVVGGIPEKVRGAVESGEFHKILIPAGLRNSPNHAGQLVDVIQYGRDNDVEVVEVADIYAAYQEFTGKALPAPTNTSDPRVEEPGYTKLTNAANAEMAEFDRLWAEFQALDPYIQDIAWPLAEQGMDSANTAKRMQGQGLQGAAFSEALAASLTMKATVSAYRTAQDVLISGDIGVLNTKINAAQAADPKFMAFLDLLSTYEPKNLTDVETLVTTYGNAFDAFSLLIYAQNGLQVVFDTSAQGGYGSLEEALDASMWPLVLFELASAQVDAARAIFEVGRDLEGGSISDAVDLQEMGDFLRRAADANWAAFETGVIQPAAENNGVSNSVMLNHLTNNDFTVALSSTAKDTQFSIANYIGEGKPNSSYAAMGYGFLNYARNAILIEKYYNNGVLDENYMVVDVRSHVILSRALDMGRSQVAGALQPLYGHDTAPVLTVGSFEQAGVDREGDMDDKFLAIQSYSASFIMARTLSYLGGFPTDGYSRTASQ